jgi:hypothetical protein
LHLAGLGRKQIDWSRGKPQLDIVTERVPLHRSGNLTFEREGLIAGVHTEINEMKCMLDSLHPESMAKEK